MAHLVCLLKAYFNVLIEYPIAQIFKFLRRQKKNVFLSLKLHSVIFAISVWKPGIAVFAEFSSLRGL